MAKEINTVELSEDNLEKVTGGDGEVVGEGTFYISNAVWGNTDPQIGQYYGTEMGECYAAKITGFQDNRETIVFTEGSMVLKGEGVLTFQPFFEGASCTTGSFTLEFGVRYPRSY